MPRLSTVLKLSPEQHAKVDALIRHYRYVNTDAVQQLLEQEGIAFTRSALHRYMARLKRADGAQLTGDDRTVIVLIDRATGATTTVTSPASKEAVLASISALDPLI